MCIIILQKQGNQISKQYIKNSLENNSDGSGIVYVDKTSKKNKISWSYI